MKEMLIKYNASCDRWCRSDGKIYRQDKNGKFIECKQTKRNGYLAITVYVNNKHICKSSHRLIWETLKGPIQNNMQIDHINAIRTDNRLENLRCVSPKENSNNEVSKQHLSDSLKNKHYTEFGKKYIEYFGYSENVNPKQYNTEHHFYKRFGHCRWE